MPAYTICPSFIEFAGQNKKYITDVLMVFVPDNSKTICIDREELLLLEYEKFIEVNKDLIDWYKFMSMFKDLNFTKIKKDKTYSDLLIHICEKSYDKILITDCVSSLSGQKKMIEDKEIKLLDKDLAKVMLNYGDAGFPETSKSSFIDVTKDNVFDIVHEICNQFKDVIENKGLFKLLVNSSGNRVHENKAQLLFFGVAYSHCFANDLKLSPEVDSGNGPVDFNISKGFRANVNVEMKFADNPKLKKGLWSQLEIYNKAENTDKSIYLIIKTNSEYDRKIAKLLRVLDYRKKKGKNLPDIVIIDSIYKESASIR